MSCILFAFVLAPKATHGAGSGFNVAIVVNQASSNSLALANDYAEHRGIPPQNIIRVTWPGGNVGWLTTDFTNVLLHPLLHALAARGISNQIDYVVLSMDLPYRLGEAGADANSTTAALFYGFKPDPNPPCTLANNSANSYSGSERIFRSNKPATATGWSFLTTMLTAESLDQARALIDSGVLGDATHPTNLMLLQKTSDPFRNVRFYGFDDALANLRLRAGPDAVRTNGDQTTSLGVIGGLSTGRDIFSLSNTVFAPGTVADSLTSFGGAIFEGGFGQTTLLAFLQAGAAGSYGTVTEPCNFREKFPDPAVYFYQSRGFSLAEAYYQSIVNPYQGLIVGDPLSAPFRRTNSLNWIGLPPGAELSGVTNLALVALADKTARPAQTLELYVDGTLHQTITNITPAAGNELSVTINGRSMNYTVPASATVASVTAGLAAVLNNSPNPNFTGVNAFAFGDRIELRATSASASGASFTVSVGQSQGTATALTTFLTSARTNLLETTAFGFRSYTNLSSTTIGSVIGVTVTKTNGAALTLAVTNDSGTLTLGAHSVLLCQLINNTPALQGADGLLAEDFIDFTTAALFNLRARTAGGAAAQIRADFFTSGGPTVTPAAQFALTQQLPDLQARNHLYVSAGRTNLSAIFPFNTSQLADGFHELAAVASEGTHVRTQTRATVLVFVRNTPLDATLTLNGADSLTAIETNFTVQVTANTNTVTLIELFSTGGWLAAATNQASATFTVSSAYLGLGRHPLYALVTAGGASFRTTNAFVRVAGAEAEIRADLLTIAPPTVTWPGVAGRRYQILSSEDAAAGYLPRDTVTASNSVLNLWTDPLAPNTLTQRFYKVGVSH